MADPILFQRAVLLPVDPKSGKPDPSKQIEVHFNPENLKLTRENNLQADTKGGNEKSDSSQHVDTSGAKLTLDLLFDTTLDYEKKQKGADVRKITQQLVELYVTPPKPEGDKKPAAARALMFVWGTFQFNGLVKSMSETLDFFSASGVPLRATVSLSLEENRYKAKLDGWSPPPPRALATSGSAPLSSVMSGAGGNPADWRGVALFNGLETPRFSASAMVMGSASASFGISGGLSASAGASVGFSAGASASLGTTVPGAFGASASAGFSASASASATAGASASIGATADASAGASFGFG